MLYRWSTAFQHLRYEFVNLYGISLYIIWAILYYIAVLYTRATAQRIYCNAYMNLSDLGDKTTLEYETVLLSSLFRTTYHTNRTLHLTPRYTHYIIISLCRFIMACRVVHNIYIYIHTWVRDEPPVRRTSRIGCYMDVYVYIVRRYTTCARVGRARNILTRIDNVFFTTWNKLKRTIRIQSPYITRYIYILEYECI